MHCSTIIVSYNTFDLTREAVRSALGAADGLTTEVIVVDNHSPDASADRLREAFPPAAFPNVHVINNTHNAGFSAANNQGARQSGGAVLFFLNPDTVVHGQAIRTLYEFLTAHPDAGAAGPHVLNPDGSDQQSTSPFRSPLAMMKHYLPFDTLLQGRTRKRASVPVRTQAVDIVKGCALAMRREVFDAVGGWDESYFMYSEETELCHALRQAGYVNYFVREARITHYDGASSRPFYAQQQVVQQRSNLQFLRRHHGPGLVLVNRVAGTLGFSLRALFFGLMARLRPKAADDYRRRGEAASTLWRWFLFEYS